MSTTPEQIADLTSAHIDAHQDLLDFSTSLDARVAAKEQEVDRYITQQKACGFTSTPENDDAGSWDRVFSITHRVPIQVTVNTTGGWFSPGSVTFQLLIDYSGNLFVNTVSKLGAQYATKVRMTTDNADNGPSFIEIYLPHRHQQKNPVTVEAIGHELPNVTYINSGVDLPSLNKLTPEVIL